MAAHSTFCAIPKVDAAERVSWEVINERTGEVIAVKTTQRAAERAADKCNRAAAKRAGTVAELETVAVEILKAAPSEVLAAAARGELDLNKIARRELASRGQNWNGEWVGFEKAGRLANCSPVRRADGRIVPVFVPGSEGR